MYVVMIPQHTMAVTLSEIIRCLVCPLPGLKSPLLPLTVTGFVVIGLRCEILKLRSINKHGPDNANLLLSILR